VTENEEVICCLPEGGDKEREEIRGSDRKSRVHLKTSSPGSWVLPQSWILMMLYEMGEGGGYSGGKNQKEEGGMLKRVEARGGGWKGREWRAEQA